jgi:hypothetical protein
MKNLLCILLFSLVVMTSCKKVENTTGTATLPFENFNIKIELVKGSVPLSVQDIQFLNASVGFAVSYEGKIFKTTNSGQTWDVKYTNPMTNPPFYQIFFKDINVG